MIFPSPWIWGREIAGRLCLQCDAWAQQQIYNRIVKQGLGWPMLTFTKCSKGQQCGSVWFWHMSVLCDSIPTLKVIKVVQSWAVQWHFASCFHAYALLRTYKMKAWRVAKSRITCFNQSTEIFMDNTAPVFESLSRVKMTWKVNFRFYVCLHYALERC